MTEVPIGHRIRERRRELRMTQVALAEVAGISPSYLNLIEHDRRRVGGGLLRRLADALQLQPQALSGAEESRVVAELAELATDPVFRDLPFESDDAARLLAAAPRMARAMLALYRAYRDLQGQVDELSERLSSDPFLADASHQILTLITTIRSFSEILRDYGDLDEAQRQRFLATVVGESENLTQVAQEMFDFLSGQGARRPFTAPAQEVDDLIYDNGNYFPSLEDAAEQLRGRLLRRAGPLHTAMLNRLERQHGIAVAFRPPDELPPDGYRHDGERQTLLLSEALPEASCRFQTARLLARLEAGDAIDAVAADPRLTGEAARVRARGALLSYLAGALLFPYEAFLEDAEALRYDVDALALRYAGSFEQITHRLTTLRRPGREGVPFHFLRTDIAGNISKRFSASGLGMPHYGGACPRWAIHQALLTPGQPIRQLAELPNGDRFLFVACTVAKPANGYGRPRSVYSVMFGCDAAFAPKLVYADGLDVDGGPATPVGISCPQCPREDCAQRAFPRAGTMPPADEIPAETAGADDDSSGVSGYYRRQNEGGRRAADRPEDATAGR